jgi:hypothetical protein
VREFWVLGFRARVRLHVPTAAETVFPSRVRPQRAAREDGAWAVDLSHFS